MQASEKLWSLVVVQGELAKHLTALRDYFLLGRGDFWQNFLVEVRNRPPTQRSHCPYCGRS